MPAGVPRPPDTLCQSHPAQRVLEGHQEHLHHGGNPGELGPGEVVFFPLMLLSWDPRPGIHEPWPKQPDLTNLSCVTSPVSMNTSLSRHIPALLLGAFLLSPTAIPDRPGHIWGLQAVWCEERPMVKDCEAHLPHQLCRESPGKEKIWWDVKHPVFSGSLLLFTIQGI